MAAKIIDKIVTVSVTDATSVADSTAVNTVAALVSVSADDYKVSGSDGVDVVTITGSSEASGYGDEAVAIATSFFGEENPGQLTLALTNEEYTGDNVATLLEAAISAGAEDCYHWLFWLDPLGTDDDDNVAVSDAVALCTALQSWAGENDKLVHVELESQAEGDALMQGLAALAPSRVAVYSHDADDYCLAAAVCANNCADDPAKGTWAYTQLDSITADSISVANFVSYVQTDGLNVYHTVKGLNVLTFGTTGSATDFVDQIVKQDWLKFRVQEAILTLLVTANSNRGVLYCDEGIQGVAAAVNNVLNVANSNGYIMDDWEVTAPKYSEIEAAQIKKRNLPDVTATFSIMNSIHTVQTVKLVITL